jgi:hypothetical protein
MMVGPPETPSAPNPIELLLAENPVWTQKFPEADIKPSMLTETDHFPGGKVIDAPVYEFVPVFWFPIPSVPITAAVTDTFVVQEA